MQLETPSPQPLDLAPNQITVLSRLLAGDSVTEASNAAGVHRSTVYLWLRQDSFRTHYHLGRRNRALSVSDTASEIAELALCAVVQVLSDEQASPSARLRAATLVLQTSLQPLSSKNTRQNSTEFDTTGIFPFVEPSVEPVAPAQPDLATTTGLAE